MRLYDASGMRQSHEPRSGCPINATVEVFGDRWSLLVLRDIVFGDRRYFRELQAGSEEGIASNILADRLKRLVEVGLLTREDTRSGQRALQPHRSSDSARSRFRPARQLGPAPPSHEPRAQSPCRTARTGRPTALAAIHGRTPPHPPRHRHSTDHTDGPPAIARCLPRRRKRLTHLLLASRRRGSVGSRVDQARHFCFRRSAARRLNSDPGRDLHSCRRATPPQLPERPGSRGTRDSRSVQSFTLHAGSSALSLLPTYP